MKKKELLGELEASRERLLELIDDLQDEAFEEPGVNGSWSLKDVLAHLSRWESELVKLLWQAFLGQSPTSAQFSGISIDKLNEKWYNDMRARRLELVLEDYHNVRNQTMRRIEDFSEEELNDEKRYHWLGGRPLWTWVAADSYDHEYEHSLQIKVWRDKKSAV